MKFVQRFVANWIAIFLVLYLVDSVAGGRFLLASVWVAVFLSLVLSLLNSPIKPLHKVRTKTVRALVVSLLTLLVDVLVIQIFAWTTPFDVANLSWVFFVAAFVAVIAGAINYLLGFGPTAKERARAAAQSTKGIS